MIYLYTGTPGSGKTLSAVKKVMTSHKHVITNICLDESAKKHADITYVETYDLSPKLLYKYYKKYKPQKEGSLLLVFDEAQQVLGCRDWGAADRKAWTSFFMEHRKLRFEVILITQWSKMLDKQILPLIDYEYNFRRMSRFGWFGFFVYILTFGEKYLVIEKYKPLDMVIGKHLSMVGRRYYKFYNSFQILTKYFEDDNEDEEEELSNTLLSERTNAPDADGSADASSTQESGADDRPRRSARHFRK